MLIFSQIISFKMSRTTINSQFKSHSVFKSVNIIYNFKQKMLTKQ